MTFFLNLATKPSQDEVSPLAQWSILQELVPQSSNVGGSKSQTTFIPDESKGSVKKLYSGNLIKNLSASSRTQVSFFFKCRVNVVYVSVFFLS